MVTLGSFKHYFMTSLIINLSHHHYYYIEYLYLLLLCLVIVFCYCVFIILYHHHHHIIIINMDIRNMLIRFAIFNGILMPRLLSEEEYNAEIDHCDFALDEFERELVDRPGRGHQRPGLVKRPP